MGGGSRVDRRERTEFNEQVSATRAGYKILASRRSAYQPMATSPIASLASFCLCVQAPRRVAIQLVRWPQRSLACEFVSSRRTQPEFCEGTG